MRLSRNLVTARDGFPFPPTFRNAGDMVPWVPEAEGAGLHFHPAGLMMPPVRVRAVRQRERQMLNLPTPLKRDRGGSKTAIGEGSAGRKAHKVAA